MESSEWKKIESVLESVTVCAPNPVTGSKWTLSKCDKDVRTATATSNADITEKSSGKTKIKTFTNQATTLGQKNRVQDFHEVHNGFPRAQESGGLSHSELCNLVFQFNEEFQDRTNSCQNPALTNESYSPLPLQPVQCPWPQN